MKWQYDEWERKQIFREREDNPYVSLVKAKQYIEKYSEDYMGYLTYAGLLIDVGRVEEAKEVLDYVGPETKIYQDYYKKVAKTEILPLKHICELIRYYIYTEQYEKAYELCSNNTMFMKARIQHIYAVEAFLFEKLGMYDQIQNTGYLTSQMVDYSFDRFKEHITRHLQDTGYYHKHKSIFSSDFPFDKVIEEAQKYIPSDKRNFYACYINDKYVFKYDNSGRMDGKIADYFEIVTLHDSDKLVSMFPISYGANYPHVDLNYLKEDKPRVKKMSQIEKFNKKYNL